MIDTIELQEWSRGTRCCTPDAGPRLEPAAAQQLPGDHQILSRLQILDILTRLGGKSVIPRRPCRSSSRPCPTTRARCARRG